MKTIDELRKIAVERKATQDAKTLKNIEDHIIEVLAQNPDCKNIWWNVCNSEVTAQLKAKGYTVRITACSISDTIKHYEISWE